MDHPAAPARPSGVCGPTAEATHLPRRTSSGSSSGPAWRLALAALLTGLLATGPALTGSTVASAASPAGSLGSAATAGSHPARVATARVIVRYRAGASLQTATAGRRQILAARSSDPIVGLRHASVLGQRLGLALRDGRTIAHRTQVIQATGLDSQALARRLASDPEVEFAIVDQRRHIAAAPNDVLYSASTTISPSSGQWYLRAPDSTVISSVNAEAAWDITRGNADIVVAVLDTGVRPDHPDLAGRLVAGYDFINDSSVAADGQFTTSSNARDGDPSDPGDAVTQGECDPGDATANPPVPPSPAEDSSWHGTQTAGLVGAATGNGIGMAGLGRQVLVQPVRVLGHCGGFDSDIVAAMQWAAGIAIPDVPANPTPARVINLSLGSTGSCNTSASANPGGFDAARLYVDTIAAVNARQAMVVVAAGNDSLDVNLPANCAGAIGVVGLRHAGTKNGFSSLGGTASIAAPGGNCPSTSTETCLYAMLSTFNSGTTRPGRNTWSNSNNAAVGTSFSTPLVSATAALMLSANPGLSPAQLNNLIKTSARGFPTTGGGDPQTPDALPGQVPTCGSPTASTEQHECYCTTTTCGAGMLDAGAAVRAAAAGVTVANFVASTDYASVGQRVTLSAAAQPAAGRSISSLLWSVDGGGGSVASLVGSATADSVSLQGGTAAGFVTVRLAVRDSAGNIVSTAQRISFGTVSNDVVLPGSVVNTGGSGGGTTPAKSGGGAVTGDALGAIWLLGLALAALFLRPLRRASRAEVGGADVVTLAQCSQRPVRPPPSRVD